MSLGSRINPINLDEVKYHLSLVDNEALAMGKRVHRGEIIRLLHV
jgi:hypothetical protein